MNFRSHHFKAITVFIFVLTTSFSFSQQDFQGKATYLSKTTIDMDNFGRGDMSEEQKKQIAERMKSMLEKTYFLVFNKTESTYKEEEKLDTPGQSSGFRMMMGNFTGGAQYKDVKENVLLQEQEFFGKQFLIKDSLPKFEWKMSGETKQIGQYACFKATATKKVDAMDFRSMRRKNNDDASKKETDSTKTKDVMDEIEVPETIEVTAWYTMQIPVNQGPGEYWGLPGLILEVHADRTTILCSKIVLNPEDKEDIKKPEKGKEVTQEEYNDIMKKKIEEMREMYGGRGRGGH
ncbi:GLPGLI family protein [Formosa maritima]|uniref:GLPGLI family protein n=1 Tax=Formosa maritima TaxID=2592046 RepID=A0A5D0GGA8_9FLAO|nr:GLPGLI family protein [Formosa maritima]TYA58014.1 GLPGLI family protein [Formosa maritima]